MKSMKIHPQKFGGVTPQQQPLACATRAHAREGEIHAERVFMYFMDHMDRCSGPGLFASALLARCFVSPIRVLPFAWLAGSFEIRRGRKSPRSGGVYQGFQGRMAVQPIPEPACT